MIDRASPALPRSSASRAQSPATTVTRSHPRAAICSPQGRMLWPPVFAGPARAAHLVAWAICSSRFPAESAPAARAQQRRPVLVRRGRYWFGAHLTKKGPPRRRLLAALGPQRAKAIDVHITCVLFMLSLSSRTGGLLFLPLARPCAQAPLCTMDPCYLIDAPLPHWTSRQAGRQPAPTASINPSRLTTTHRHIEDPTELEPSRPS